MSKTIIMDLLCKTWANYNYNIWGSRDTEVILTLISNSNLFIKEFFNRYIFRNISNVKYIQFNELLI